MEEVAVTSRWELGENKVYFLSNHPNTSFIYCKSSRSFLISWLYPLSWSETLGKTGTSLSHIGLVFSTVVLFSQFVGFKAEHCSYLCSGLENRQFGALQISFKLHFVRSTPGLQVINNSNNSKHQECYELWAFHQNNMQDQ